MARSETGYRRLSSPLWSPDLSSSLMVCTYLIGHFAGRFIIYAYILCCNADSFFFLAYILCCNANSFFFPWNVVMLLVWGLVQRTSSLTIGEKFGTIIHPLLAVLDYVIAIFTSCLTAKSRNSPFGYEDPVLLASETLCKSLKISVILLWFQVRPPLTSQFKYCY